MSNEKNLATATIEPISWGSVHCCECDEVICYYPPESPVAEDCEFEFYCFQCAVAQKHDH